MSTVWLLFVSSKLLIPTRVEVGFLRISKTCSLNILRQHRRPSEPRRSGSPVAFLCAVSRSVWIMWKTCKSVQTTWSDCPVTLLWPSRTFYVTVQRWFFYELLFLLILLVSQIMSVLSQTDGVQYYRGKICVPRLKMNSWPENKLFCVNGRIFMWGRGMAPTAQMACLGPRLGWSSGQGKSWEA